jgi:AcrR family transcriptional regulator
VSGTAAVPGGRREQTKERNRAALLDAGREVFARLGYDAASVRDIVRETGLASGTFSTYFPDKEAVFRALLEVSARELRERLRAARREAGDLAAFVGDAYHAFFAYLAEDPTLFALLRRNTGPIRDLLGEPVLGLGVEELREDLEAAIARGDLPGFDADYMAAAMAGVGLEVAERMVERDPIDPEAAAAFVTELFLGGIARLDPARR